MQAAWFRLTGSPEAYSLEARIFHLACLFTVLLFSCSIVFNYLIGLYSLSLMLIPALFAVSFVYYLSKVKYLLNLSVNIFCTAGNLLFIFFFLNNSGINGPGFIIYLLFFFLVMSIVRKSQRTFWVAINFTVAGLLVFFQYHFPEMIPLNYKTEISRYMDFFYVYSFTLVIIYLIITNIINNYNKERLLAETRQKELERANESKNKLFSILAHDLKSPLNSIQNFLEISMEVDINEEEKRTINSSLLNETRYTRQMLINLLSWSKTQMEGVNVKLVKLELVKALESTILLQESLAKEKNIRLNNKLEKNVHIIADSDMLELVIRNLLNNAIKFTPFDGVITISSEIHGHECWIKVEDTGVGIPEEDYDGLFSLRSESTYGTNNEKGVGLGLVLCKEFISLQHGNIWVESTVNVGTTFFVSFELAVYAELFPLHLN